MQEETKVSEREREHKRRIGLEAFIRKRGGISERASGQLGPDSFVITFAVDALPVVFLGRRDHVGREVEAARMKVFGAFTADHERLGLAAPVLLIASEANAALFAECLKQRKELAFERALVKRKRAKGTYGSSRRRLP